MSKDFSYDWSTFEVKIWIDAPKQKVFDYWVVPNKLSTWFLEKADYFAEGDEARNADMPVKAGDTYNWKWQGYETIEKGKVLENDGQSCFRFSFAGDCEVTVKAEEIDSASTRLVITQSNIPLDEASKVRIHMGCRGGWSFHMLNLKSILEQGKDLRGSTYEPNIVNM